MGAALRLLIGGLAFLYVIAAGAVTTWSALSIRPAQFLRNA